MRKWTKGFLIFGMTTTILGTCLLFAGGAHGVKEIIALSNKAVYTDTESKYTIQEPISKLDIHMNKHEILLIDSPDDQVHITYHQRVSGQRDFDYTVKNGVLQLTDQDQSSSRHIGSSLDFLLEIPRAMTGSHSQIEIALPKRSLLKDVKVHMTAPNKMFGMVNLVAEHIDLQSSSYFNTINNSVIKGGTIETKNHLTITDSQLSNLTIQTGDQLRLDETTIRGEVTATVPFAELYLKKGEVEKTVYHLSSKEGEITQLFYKNADYGYDWDKEQEHGHQFQLGEKTAPNKLTLKAEDAIQIFNPKNTEEK